MTMGRIYYLIGKSATGKDTIHAALLKDKALKLHNIVPYTTRPIRDGEKEGREYHFITEERYGELKAAGRIIEERAYDTVHGIWRYMTVQDGRIRSDRDYVSVGTVEAYRKLRDHFGADRVVPVYIDVETGERLARALARERAHDNPKYTELCRRFLADERDFDEEHLRAAGLIDAEGQYVNRFENDDLARCIERIRAFIEESRK